MITTLGPVTDIQVDDLGRIYALSSSNGVWALMRLSSSGELDTNFADQGILSSTTALIRVLVQSDRRLILLSGQGGAGVIRRFDENGAPDTTYATLGQFVLPPATSIHDGDLLANDELLICGDSATTWSSVYRAFVIRLDMDGNLDTGFADDGWLITSGFANACTGTTWEGIEVRDMGDGGFVAVKYSETIEQCTPNPDMAKLRFSVHDANGVEVSGFNTMFNPFGISVTPYSISVEPGQGFDRLTVGRENPYCATAPSTVSGRLCMLLVFSFRERPVSVEPVTTSNPIGSSRPRISPNSKYTG
ncbi:MAG: delta-60 repeat domain-containing protein [Flavobacteriales bacterium]|nr:delta-60 repeat domain-containing protein [Flavobacteriales bacterium]